MGRRVAGLGVLLFALLGVPRSTEAGLIDFIWEMSGPQLIGGGYGCSFNLHWQRQNCRLGAPAALIQRSQKHFGPFISLGGEGHVSTGKNAGGIDYKAFHIYKVALTPALTLRSRSREKLSIYHGIGLTYDVLFGTDFQVFDKFGFTVTPVEFVFGEHVGLSARIRIYPHGYTADEFGFGRRLDYDRSAEAVYGFGFSWIFRKK